MVYASSYTTEGLVFHHQDDVDDMFIIFLTKNVDGETFNVDVDFDEDWNWVFKMHPSNYEMVKHTIMDIAFDCDNEDELLMELDTAFEEIFGSIVAWDERDDDCDCDHSCGHCSCK